MRAVDIKGIPSLKFEDLLIPELNATASLSFVFRDTNEEAGKKIIHNFISLAKGKRSKAQFYNKLGQLALIPYGHEPIVLSYAPSYEKTNVLYGEGRVPVFLAQKYEENSHSGLYPVGNTYHDYLHLNNTIRVHLEEYLQNALEKNRYNLKARRILKKLLEAGRFVNISEQNRLTIKIEKYLTGKLLKEFIEYEKVARRNFRKLISLINIERNKDELHFALFIVSHETHYAGLTISSLKSLKEERYLDSVTLEDSLRDHKFKGKELSKLKYSQLVDQLIKLMELSL